MKILSAINENKDIIHKDYVDEGLASKQPTLVSGTNIKTINNESLLGSGNINVETILIKHIDTSDNTQWDAQQEKPTQTVLQDISTHQYHVISLENIDIGEGNFLNVNAYLSAKLDADNLHIRQYTRFEEGDAEEDDPTGVEVWTIGNVDEENPTIYQFITSLTPIMKDFKINGSSIVEDNAANLITNSAYNANSNKIATMSDVDNYVDISSYSVGDTISDSTIVEKLKKDNVVVTNGTSKYRMADHSNGAYLYTVMNQLDGGDYFMLAETGNNLSVAIKDSTYWQLRIDANNKLSADFISDGSTNKTVTSTEKSTWNGKQNALVSGTNIKTINNESILGSGNISVGGGSSTDVQINGSSIVNNNTANIITNTAYDSNSNKIATMSDVPSVSDRLKLYSRSGYDVNTCYDAGIYLVAQGSHVPSGSNYGSLLTMPYRQIEGNTKPDFGTQIFMPNGDDNTHPNSFYYRTSLGNTWNNWQELETTSNKVTSLSSSSTNTQYPSAKVVYDNLQSKQDALVSGTNIKTLNNNSILGEGNLSLVEGTVVVSNTEPSDPNAEVWIDTSESGVVESKFKNKTWHSKAHRGNIVGHENTLRENTLGAYYNAFLKGADVIEVDARLSSDNIFMCNHDTTVTDINDVTYTISNTPAATLQALVLSTDSVYGNQGVPTLESVLKLAYTCGMKVDIDLKMFDSGMSDSQKRTFASNVAKLVAKCGMKGRATYAIVNGGSLAIPEIIAIDPEASFVTTKANLDAISNLSTILPNYKDKCYAYTADLTASTVDAIRNAGYRLELISITADNFSEAIQFYPDNLEYLHTTDFRTIEDAYFNSVILY